MNDKNRPIIIGIIVAVLMILVGFLVYYNYRVGNKNKNYTGGVSDIDFSSYENKELKGDFINSGGIYTLTGDIKNTIRISAQKADIKLVLNNVNMDISSGPAINIEAADNVYIELIGDNTIKANATSELNGAIYSKADLCFIGDGKLNITSNIDGIVGKDDLQINSGVFNINANDEGIVGKDSLVVKGGTLNIDVSGNGMKTSNEQEKGIMTIEGGTFNIKSKGDAIQSISTLTINNGVFNIESGNGTDRTLSSNSDSMKGIKSKSDLSINGGTINIKSTDDSIHTNGNLTIINSNITIESGDDGIHTDKDLYFKDSNVNVNKAYEGIEGLNITVDSGNISVISSDDGFNAAGGDGSSGGRPGSARYSNTSNSALTINGGTIYVNSQGDGLDSNGNIFITGGEITVDGPTNGGNGAMDYGDGGAYKFEVTGGTLIAVGTKDMAVTPTSGTTVTSVLMNLDNTYNEEFVFGDIKYKPTKTYNSILIVSNKLSKGNTYDLKINNNKILSLQLNDTITTSGTTGNRGGPGGGDHGGGPRR